MPVLRRQLTPLPLDTWYNYDSSRPVAIGLPCPIMADRAHYLRQKWTPLFLEIVSL